MLLKRCRFREILQTNLTLERFVPRMRLRSPINSHPYKSEIKSTHLKVSADLLPTRKPLVPISLAAAPEAVVTGFTRSDVRFVQVRGKLGAGAKVRAA
jgi:hypothetical protein